MNLILLFCLATKGAALVITEGKINVEELLESLAQTVDEAEWVLFKESQGKVYDAEEQEKRKFIYAQTRQYVFKHNEKYKEGKTTFTMCINQFSDMMLEEAKESTSGLASDYKKITKETKKKNVTIKGFKGTIQTTKLPASVDWRKTCNNWPPVKDQESCGSCWAYSAVGVMEYQMFIKTAKKTLLSEQQLIDCSKSQGNTGCAGGLMTKAYYYIVQNGITSAESYPTTNREGQCNANVTKAAEILNFQETDNIEEEELMKTLANYGPVCAAIDTSWPSIYAYDTGVYKEENCSTTVSHAVIIVGYGTEGKTNYWIIKNSWGPNWGEEGYIRVYRGNNHCGVQTLVAYPILKKPPQHNLYSTYDGQDKDE